MNIYTAYYWSDIGPLALVAREEALLSCTFIEDEVPKDGTSHLPLLKTTLAQLHAYFQGQLQSFSLPLAPEGSLFAKQVWQQLLNIPYASTVSYGAIASAIGNPKAARAVGQANHNNPLAIIVPCHRVIGRQGALVGYGGGLWRKEWLLAHEVRHT